MFHRTLINFINMYIQTIWSRNSTFHVLKKNFALTKRKMVNFFLPLKKIKSKLKLVTEKIFLIVIWFRALNFVS